MTEGCQREKALDWASSKWEPWCNYVPPCDIVMKIVFINVNLIKHFFFQVVLETEITNKAALHLYENLGFVRDKRLFRYYLNGVDALRLKLWLR